MKKLLGIMKRIFLFGFGVFFACLTGYFFGMLFYFILKQIEKLL